MPQKEEIYKLGTDGLIMYKNKIYVPNVQELKRTFLHEMRNVPYAGHPGYQKTVAAVKSHYFWPGMKKEIAEYIAPWILENCGSSQESLFLARYEERDCRIHRQMYRMPKG
jgi:hypothetical protein